MGTENCDSKIGVQRKLSSFVNEIRKCPLISVFFLWGWPFPACPSIIHKRRTFLSPLIMLFYSDYLLMKIVIDMLKCSKMSELIHW